MWYKETNTKELVYTRPIVAEYRDGRKQLLLPQIKDKSYIVIGYNWLNLDDGSYGSSMTWETPEEAVQSRLEYKGKVYKVYNVFLNVVKDGDW